MRSAGYCCGRVRGNTEEIPQELRDTLGETHSRRINTMVTSVIRASTADGRAGHPVIFPARLWPDLVRLQGDQGARDMLKSEAVQLCPLPGQHALTDLDTPEAWAAWRAAGNT